MWEGEMAVQIVKIYCPINSCLLAVSIPFLDGVLLITAPDYAGEEKERQHD